MLLKFACKIGYPTGEDWLDRIWSLHFFWEAGKDCKIGYPTFFWEAGKDLNALCIIIRRQNNHPNPAKVSSQSSSERISAKNRYRQAQTWRDATQKHSLIWSLWHWNRAKDLWKCVTVVKQWFWSLLRCVTVVKNGGSNLTQRLQIPGHPVFASIC